MGGSERRTQNRILMLGGDGAPSGVPRHIELLLGALGDAAEIIVASDRDKGGYKKIRRMADDHVIVRHLRTTLNPANLLRACGRLKTLIEATDPDIIWAHARQTLLLLRLLIVLGRWTPRKGQVIVLSYHGLPFGRGRLPGASAFSKALERRLLKDAPPSHLVFLTPEMAEEMRSAMGAALDRHQIHVLGNSSQLGDLVTGPSDPNHRRVVMTARTGWQKNYLQAVRLFAHLPEDFRLTLCGSGTNGWWFRLQLWAIASLGVRARIECLGPIPDVKVVLGNADAYMLTSRYEGVPIGTLEAFEAGLPIVLSRFDGAEDLSSHHACSLILEADDPERDAERIVSLVDEFTCNREALSASIKQSWAQHWSRSKFDYEARALLSTLLRSGG